MEPTLPTEEPRDIEQTGPAPPYVAPTKRIVFKSSHPAAPPQIDYLTSCQNFALLILTVMSVVIAGLLAGIMVTVQSTVSTYPAYESSTKTHYVKTGDQAMWAVN